MKHTTLALLAILAAASPAAAQFRSGGFVAVGQASVDHELLDPSWTFSGGWTTRLGRFSEVEFAVRGSATYSRFVPDEEAFAREVGAGRAEADGGTATVTSTGLDLVAGYDVGVFGGYGFAGLHYFQDRANELTLATDRGTFRFPGESRSDLGAWYGAGITWDLASRFGLFAEWAHGGGWEEGMFEVDALRLGLSWGW